jgi:Cu-Zn family superoxide dismutase
MIRLVPILAMAALAACATAPPPPPSGPVGMTASAEVLNAQGSRIGTAKFTEGPRGVLIRIEIGDSGLPRGWHGVHLHEKGDCADFADGFKASGAHAGHGAPAAHGLLNPAGPEAGDLPSIFTPNGGPTQAELYSPFVTLAPAAIGGRSPLRGPQGAALIIHANADDQTTQPIGGAGARIACAALTPN